MRKKEIKNIDGHEGVLLIPPMSNFHFSIVLLNSLKMPGYLS
jgi:hypothetical protein